MSNAAAPARTPPKWLLQTFTRAHVWLNAVSGGRAFNTLAGKDVCFVTMKGARSGRLLTIPLMYVPLGDAVLLVASMGGAPRHPVWYHNIVAHPAIEIRHRGHLVHYHARLARPDEKADLWPVCDAHYPPYADYRARTDRDIPIFVCEPAA
jgi:deazaflavin-dependent oxidoreductase (nitroreductase family)